MSNLIILNPYQPAAIDASRGDDVANLLTPSPKEAWVDSANGTATLDVDLGEALPIDTVFLGYTNSGIGGAFAVTCGLAGYAETEFLASRTFVAPTHSPPGRRHALATIAEPLTARYVRLTVTKAAGEHLFAGVLAIGQAFRPSRSNETGAGRFIADTGSRERLQGGGFGIDLGVATTGWQWTLGDLEDEELDQLYELVRDRRQTRSVLVVEDPDHTAGASERMHWGIFDRLEAYERRAAVKTKWSFRIEDWS